MFVKRFSSMSAASWDGVRSLSRIARRTVASRRCLSTALVKPHHVGEAYNSMEIEEIDYDDVVDVCQRVVTHSMTAQQFQSMEGLCVTMSYCLYIQAACAC